MAFVPGAGMRFAVPDIHNIKTDGYTNAVGGIAKGANGEKFQVYWNGQSLSKAAGQNAWHASRGVTANSVMNGFVADDAGSATSATHWLGAFAQTAAASGLVWVQIAGTITRVLDTDNSASASVVGHGIFGVGTASNAATAAVTANTGNYGLIWGGGATAASTLATVMLAGRALVG